MPPLRRSARLIAMAEAPSTAEIQQNARDIPPNKKQRQGDGGDGSAPPADNTTKPSNSAMLFAAGDDTPGLWEVLPEDVRGRISAYLDLAAARSLILAWGRPDDEVATIRRGYLKLNFRFLDSAVKNGELEEEEDEEEGSHGMLAAKEACAKSHGMLAAWMECNDDWKQMYDWHHQGQFPTGEADCSSFASVFSDINVAARFGLVDVVRHLVEVRGEDVNTNDTRADYTHCRPVLHACLCSPCTSMLEYLLTVNQVEADYTVHDNGSTPIFAMASEENICLERFSLLAAYIGIDGLNGQTDHHEVRPLHIAVRTLSNTTLAKVQILLEQGADPRVIENFAYTTPQEMFTLIWNARKRDGTLQRKGLDDSIKDDIRALLSRYVDIFNDREAEE